MQSGSRRPLGRRSAPKVPAWAPWVVGPVFGLAVLAGFASLRADPLLLFAVVAGGALVAVILWIVTSVLWPAHADRGCPSCGVDALVRMDPGSTIGIRCTACGFEDDAQSSWLLAEEEGPLEEVVLEQRRRKRRSRAGSS